MGLVMRARPDGHTLLASSASNHVFHPLISGEVNYDVREAFHGMAMWVDVPNVIAVHPSLPVHNVQELIAYIRTVHGGISFGSSGVGTSNHLAGELFRFPFLQGTQCSIDIESTIREVRPCADHPSSVLCRWAS